MANRLNKKLKGSKQDSATFHKLEEVVKNVTTMVQGMDVKKDTSHGIFFSSALTDEKDKVAMNMVVWGSGKDIASMFFTAAQKNPEFATLISNVAINIAVTRIRKTSAKNFTGDEAALMIANDRSLVVPEEN